MILQNPSKTSNDLIHISKVLNKIDFFRSFDKSEQLEDLAAILKYEFIPANQKVIEYGTKGEKFYILLSGYCDVIKPTLIKPREDTIAPIIDEDMNVIRKKPLVIHGHTALV